MVDVNVDFIFENEQPINADFQLEPDVTYTADIKLSEATRDHTKLYNRDRANQHPMSAITGLEDALDGLSDDITAENNRAVEAEETLDNKIDSEVDTRADEITRVEGLISDEETRAEGVEGGLREDLTAETNRATNAEGVLQTNITAEENRAKGVEQQLSSSIDSNHQAISNHVSDKNNPHEVTKAQVGLGNVENITPADMPMSTATKTYVDNADNGLQGQITTINTTIGGYGNIVTHNVSEFATASQGALADTALQPNDNISELTNNLNYQTATQVANSIAVETNNRESADNNLQSQIDAIVSASDVFDIVGTYAELQAYDISTVPVNDIIKVLEDSTHGGAATYYRCIENNNVKSWSYIGSEGASYTKAEADNRFVPQTRTVNNKALSSNIILTASDVGALPSSTVIPTVNNGQLDIQVNGSSIATFTANQSGNTTANVVVPDSATWGNITGTLSNQTDLQIALNSKYDASNPNGYITGINSSDVTTALGYTPVNPTSLANVATSGSYNDLSNKPSIPTATSDLSNDSGFITVSALSGYATESWVNNKGYITGISSSDVTTALGYTPYDSSNPAGYITSSALSPYALSSSLSAVATSGAYSDLSGKPNYGAGLSYSSSSLQLLDQNGNNLGSAVTIKSTPDLDGVTIDTNSDDELEAIGTINKNTASGATAVKYDWIGTLAEYNSQNVETLHPDWICYITDDVSGGTSVYTKTEVDNAISTALTTMLDSAFPVGSRYITEASTCPLATLIPNSTWVLTSQGRVLQGADSNHASGTTAEAGLPNLEGTATYINTDGVDETVYPDSGVFYWGNYQSGISLAQSQGTAKRDLKFSASRYNSIYGNSTTVQPPAEFVNIFKRTA